MLLVVLVELVRLIDRQQFLYLRQNLIAVVGIHNRNNEGVIQELLRHSYRYRNQDNAQLVASSAAVVGTVVAVAVRTALVGAQHIVG
jgi:hypothetical protein